MHVAANSNIYNLKPQTTYIATRHIHTFYTTSRLAVLVYQRATKDYLAIEIPKYGAQALAQAL